MDRYRAEIRIFGLLIFALVSTSLLAWGLEAGDVQGEVAGVSFRIVGPAVFLLVQILIFFATGLFKFGLERESSDVLDRPIERLSLEEVERLLDDLVVQSRRIQRRQQNLEAAKRALQDRAPAEDVMTAAGIRPALRGGR